MGTKTKILIFGSDSKPLERDIFVPVQLVKQIIYKAYNIFWFYDHMHTLELMHGYVLDSAGLAFDRASLHVFIRARIIIFSCPSEEFIAYCILECIF